MDLMTTLEEMTTKLDRLGRESIGLILTKGALHNGQISLIKEARKENKYVIVCSFLNPEEFASEEDYQLYPRALEEDIRKASLAGADFFFYPSFKELYPSGHMSYITIASPLMTQYEGQISNKYYKCILTTYHILLSQIRPQRLYLGEKDIQKRVLLAQMIRDFGYGCQIRLMPTIREEDGLILNSKTQLLGLDERRQATSLYKALQKAATAYERGNISAYKLKLLVEGEIKRYYLMSLEYVEIVETQKLRPIETLIEGAYILAAARVGRVRIKEGLLLKTKHLK